MWWLLSAGAAWALPFGAGVSGLYDLPQEASGTGSLFGLETKGPGCGKAENETLSGGCDAVVKDAELGPTIGVLAPLFISIAPNAAVRVEARASYSNGKVRVLCEQQGGCQYNDAAPEPMTQGTYRASRLHLPSLSVAAGPDVRLTSGNGIAPHVAALVGAGVVGNWLDSDYFDEVRGLNALQPVVSAAGTVGLTSRPGFNGWFVDLSYTATAIPGRDDVLKDDGELRVAPFAVNGVRLDVGLLFAD